LHVQNPTAMQLEILSEWCAVSGREKHWSPQISLAFTIFSAQFNCIVPALGEGTFAHMPENSWECQAVVRPGSASRRRTILPPPAGDGRGRIQRNKPTSRKIRCSHLR
jgi:hypothetical protein